MAVKKKVIILSGSIIVLLVSAGAGLAYWYHQSRPAAPGMSSDILDTEERERLKKGECSDDTQELLEAQTANTKNIDSLKTLADCYTLRKDYQRALSAFERIKDAYSESEDDTGAKNTENVINSIRRFVEMEDGAPEGGGGEEPMAN